MSSNQGQLTDEEFRVLKAADEKMKCGRPNKEGFYKFKALAIGTGLYFWTVAIVQWRFGEKQYQTWEMDNSEWKLVSQTADDQWAGEIRMPEDGE